MNLPAFFVRDIPVYGSSGVPGAVPAILAPMDGYSDLPFRKLCREYGSAMSYTEFVAVEAIRHGAKKALKMLDFDPTEQPQMSFQIFGPNENDIVEAAKRCEQMGAGIVDLNMGCSVPNVSGRGAGAGLLRDPAKIGRIFNAMSRALSIPVTGKIRIGWDAQSLNHVEVARVMEDNGASLVAVHGRTKEQKYTGHANWDAIAEVKQAVKIPVIGNGDVRRVEDIARMKAHTGCDGVMIARAAIGNPWIFSGRNREDVLLRDVTRLMRRHLDMNLRHYGDYGLILFRKYAARYIIGVPGAAELRHALVTAPSVDIFLDHLAGLESRADDLDRQTLEMRRQQPDESPLEPLADLSCAESRCDLMTGELTVV